MSLLHTTYRVFSERRGISFLLYCRAPQSKAEQRAESRAAHKKSTNSLHGICAVVCVRVLSDTNVTCLLT